MCDLQNKEKGKNSAIVGIDCKKMNTELKRNLEAEEQEPTHVFKENDVFVKVIKTPEGDAPEEVRKEWVGLVLPVFVIEPYKIGREQLLISEKIAWKRPESCTSRVLVSKSEALIELARKNKKAAKYFFDKCKTKTLNGYFSFGNNEVLIHHNPNRQKSDPEELIKLFS